MLFPSQIQFCISQYKSGERTDEHFVAADHRNTLEYHYNALITWRARKKDEVALYQVRIWDKIMYVLFVLIYLRN
jgi:hypothetical protein